MAEGRPLKVGSRVEVIGKELVGTVAYIGTTLFSSGKWIGVALDEPRGKNDGTVQGKSYFSCAENHGMFVRQSQLKILDEPETKVTPGQTKVTPGVEKKRVSGIKPPSAGRSSSDMTKSRESLDSTTASEDEPKSTRPTSIQLTQKDSKEPVVEQEKSASAKKPPLPESAAATTAAAVSQATTEISAMSSTINAQIENLRQQQEIEGLKAEVKDLQEKLETLKVKRAQDTAKLKEFEKVKIQLQQLQEYKSKMQTTQMDLQRQLQATQKECSDTQESFERYKEEMSEVAESIELATLDKEMAEEKCETLQQENEQLKEKVEELTVDLQLLKEEIAAAGSSEGVASTYQVKQLEQQHERMKDALVKLRDLSNCEKQENVRLQKQIDGQKAEISSLTKDRDKLEKDVSRLSEEIIELKEHVDASQGAEEMVEQLTEKTLQQEERIQQLEEEKTDLEALCDMNEELQESSRELELQLREDVDMAKAREAESLRKVDAVSATIADYELTINKFRDHVARQQEIIQELKSGSESKSVVATPTIEFDFKAKFAETKATAKAIELELRKIEAQQARKHVELLSTFLPEAFLRRGGDNDAILVLLLIPRLMAKCELLMTQVRQKYEIPETLQRDDVVQSGRSELFGFANNFIYSLCILHAILKQFDGALNVCNVELLLKIGTLLGEMIAYEKILDGFIDLLCKDELDKSSSMESLDKMTIYFRQLYNIFMAAERSDCQTVLSSHTRTLLAATSCLSIDVSALKLTLQPGQEVANISMLLKDIDQSTNDVKVAARKIKRRLPSNGESVNAAPITFSSEVQSQLEESILLFSNVVKVARLMASASSQLISTLIDKLGLSSDQMEKLAERAVEKIFGKVDNSLQELKRTCSEASRIIKHIATAMENGEYDFDGTPDKRPLPPIHIRAMAVKSDFADIENIKGQLASRDDMTNELKRLLKQKQDEVGELQIRIGMADKRLENAAKESDDKVDRIQQKFDELTMTMKKKDKDHEQAMDALQADIDALENERRELMERIKEMSRKTLMEGIVRQTTTAGLTSLATQQAAAAGGGAGDDSPALIQQIESLTAALQFTRSENRKLLGRKMKEQLDTLPVLKIPQKKNSPDADVQKLSRDVDRLLHEMYSECANAKVIDVSKRKPGVMPEGSAKPSVQFANQQAKLIALRRSVEELQAQVSTMITARQPGGQVRTDFAIFPTPEFARALHEKTSKESCCIAKITIPRQQGGTETIPMNVGLGQLKQIHSHLLN
jgi:dynactin 1